MNKNAIKKFAISARTRLIATVSDKAGTLGITKDGISEPSSKGNGFEVYKTSAGTEVMLQGSQMEQRRRLVAQVNARGFDVVMEEVAYTWFNRICAIRFMEVNDYLPSRIRVLSSLKEGKNEPDLLTEAPNVDLDLSEKDREWIINAKAENRLDELFSMLFIKQCNKLSEILPELFEATQDYTEMLLNLSYTNKDDVIRMLVDGVDEKDFNVTTPDENGKPTGQVEIIGWLYQYYNTELKDDTFAQLKKNVKISKERIPAATQLFTPDWIVRYMVENSVGRIWIEHLRAINPETDEKTTAEGFGWKYYLPEAEQEPEVNTKLAEIRKSYAEIKPEDILCIDPCMGSGHIIVAMFDVLMDIYKSVGYGERDAAFEIVEHNLHGLDIDKRAYQLAYFAVMMKGRQYNRRFFRGKEEGQRPQPKVFAFVESNGVNRAHLEYFGTGLSELEKNNAITQMNGLLDTFMDAREYGSVLSVNKYDWSLLRRFIANTDYEGQMTLDAIGVDRSKDIIEEIICIAEVLLTEYDAVVTNPPYMGSSNVNKTLLKYLDDNYEEYRSDLSTVFMEKSRLMCKKTGYYALINIPVWMFISRFEKMRENISLNSTYINLLHLGRGVFGSDFGTVAFCLKKGHIPNYVGEYLRLFNEQGSVSALEEKEKWFYEENRRYYVSQDLFRNISGAPIAYSFSKSVFETFRHSTVEKVSESKAGVATSDNDTYLRLWYEIDFSKTYLSAENIEDFHSSGKRYAIYNKGGQFRRWYGNLDYLIKFDSISYQTLLTIGNKLPSRNYYFRKAITWSDISMRGVAFRYEPQGSIFDGSADVAFPDERYFYYLLGLLNTNYVSELSTILNPTIHFKLGDYRKIPFIYDESIAPQIESKVKECISISKEDWDEQEVSWDFQKNPLLLFSETSLSEAYEKRAEYIKNRFERLKANEESLNDLFSKIYHIEGDIPISVNEKDVTVKKVNLYDEVRNLLSYAVGCIFGRYSIDKPGLVYAGGEWDKSKYSTFMPDDDAIIPICDEEYFEDDIVSLFCNWLRVVYGTNTLEDNLDFIARALENKGDTSREVIRNYFLEDFFKDHCVNYSVSGSGKRPIYWLFDAGKENGFKALIYMHRYNQDTVGRVRTDYLHKTQKAIEQAMQSAQYTLENSKSGTEKSRATKRISKYTKQLAEIQLYDEAIAHIANKRIALDLDDGVRVNYEKFQGVEVSREGMKTVKVDLLAKI